MTGALYSRYTEESVMTSSVRVPIDSDNDCSSYQWPFPPSSNQPLSIQIVNIYLHTAALFPIHRMMMIWICFLRFIHVSDHFVIDYEFLWITRPYHAIGEQFNRFLMSFFCLSFEFWSNRVHFDPLCCTVGTRLWWRDFHQNWPFRINAQNRSRLWSK